MAQATGETPRAERRVVPQSGAVQYLELMDDRGIRLSVHQPRLYPGTVYLTGCNLRDDYRPVRLDVAGARALRDALTMFIEDQDKNRHDTRGTEHETR